ncbi:hypothetical protein HUT16_06705 [Kitasatospora sp. NA04385]|uniref:hypothetical protein n=1 Tax=Kitasatospora sp. NA04385 TaxID=2742135 RepID=UPI001590C72C|nr:hypothetical protein [Kitasatospora sp. NA04385]QKW18796.1 hypothetical protein HUT16_06705 [Kitasatospora sp. NA04385]
MTTELPHHRALLAAVDWPSLEVPHPTERLDAALLARMTDPDPAERARAAEAVFSLVDHQETGYGATPWVARYVAAALRHPDVLAGPPSCRAGLLRWIARTADDAEEARTAAAFWGTAEDEEHPPLREFRALRPELFAAVRPFLTDGHPDVRAAALFAALPLSEHPELAGHHPELVGHAESFLAASTDRYRRGRVLGALRRRGRDTAALETAEDRAAREEHLRRLADFRARGYGVPSLRPVRRRR